MLTTLTTSIKPPEAKVKEWHTTLFLTLKPGPNPNTNPTPNPIYPTHPTHQVIG